MTGSIRRALLGLLLAGCIVSPQPSPPNLSPDLVRPGDPTGDVVDGTRLVGAPGAVDPAMGAIVGTNLDEEVPIVAEPVRADGSFEIVVPGSVRSERRLQVRDGSLRSRPIDLVLTDPAMQIALAPRPLADCLFLDPEDEHDFGTIARGASADLVLQVDNTCEGDVTLAPSRLRESASPFSIVSDATTIAAGTSVSIVVRAAPTEAGSVEGTLFVEARAPLRDRRPITLFARGTD